MTDKKSQKDDRPPAPRLEDLWVMDTEMPTTSETIKGWINSLPWRKKKRKRD